MTGQMTQGRGIWAYAVTEQGQLTGPDGDADLSWLAGVGESPVRTVACSGLAVLVSDVSLAEFGEAALRENMEDLEWLDEVARQHHFVVDAAARFFPLLPVRLATVYSGDAAVCAALAEHHDQLQDTLGQIGGRVEWGVKAYAAAGPEDGGQGSPGDQDETAAWPGAADASRLGSGSRGDGSQGADGPGAGSQQADDPQQAGSQQAGGQQAGGQQAGSQGAGAWQADSQQAGGQEASGQEASQAGTSRARSGGSGLAYLRRRRDQLAAGREARAAAVSGAQAVHAGLAGKAAAAMVRPPQSPQLSQVRQPMLLNAAYLLDSGDAPNFTAAVAAEASAHPELRIELTGPWPPYSFASADDDGR